MDDGFLALPTEIGPLLMKQALNELHPAIQFTMETGNKKPENIESLNFLDIEVILRDGKFITTDIYYKETNPHDYLNFHSAHPFHIKQTIPFNLAKRIIVFVSDPEHMNFRLRELENWLLRCEYPKDLIKQAFHKAKVQGPAPFKEKNVIPLVTTYYPNVSYTHVIKTISTLINCITDPSTKEKFQNTKPILALKQPPNLTSLLTKAKFISEHYPMYVPTPGITLCKRKNCKLCHMYLQPVSSFQTANGTTWKIKRQLSCNSINVVYFLSCNSCEGTSNSTTYIGQTTNLRNRMNNHMSECRTGKSSCNFPKHVFECAKANNSLKEPFFKVFVFMALTDAKLLLHYESKLFKAGHATLNS